MACSCFNSPLPHPSGLSQGQQGQHSLREGVGWGLALPRCQAPASSLPVGQGVPTRGRNGEPRSSRDRDRDHCTYRNPPGERAGTQLGTGYSPAPPRPHPQETHESPSTWGEKKSTDTAVGWCFSCWHSLASSSSGKAGVPEPSPDPPTQGRLIPGARGATLTTGQCPAGWAGTIFCLKRKRSTQRKTSKGPSPSHPHTNRFI